MDVLVSGTVQSLPGPEIQANYALPTAVAAKTLGRPLSGGAANVTVGLIKPGTEFGDRVNQVDLRIGKLRSRGLMTCDGLIRHIGSLIGHYGIDRLSPSAQIPPQVANPGAHSIRSAIVAAAT